MWDVGVVGGGPSGSTAARILAARGLSVVLWEAVSHPRVKPCGGALTTRALPLLPAGYEPYLTAHPRSWTFRVRGVDPVTVVRPDPYCHTVVRADFDRFLLEAARQAGVVVHEREPVRHLELATPGGIAVTTAAATYRVRYLVGADGAKGVTARLLGIARPRHGAALEVETAAPEYVASRYRERCEVDVTDAPWGYCWVIPKADRLNVGVGSFHAQGFAWRDRLARYLREVGMPADAPVLAHPLPYRWGPTRLTRGRALVVGDAAGLMDPFSAEGIYAALLSASRAAAVVAAAAERDGDVSAYDEVLDREEWPEHRLAGLTARLFYTMPRAWGQVFVRDRTLLDLYLDVIAGRSTYRHLYAATRERWWRLVRRRRAS